MSAGSSDFDWAREASLVKKYQTAEGIVVCVYKASIVKLPVDCIVNSANDILQHGGGVAKVIADVAGYQLTKEGDDYRRQYGNIPVGQVCSTTAGRLPYNCVIHAVGPRWYDYTPHTLVEVKRCEKDLYSAIYECFLEAEKKNLTSIALPAVSAAIFSVPEDFCVYHYAKATLDYSKRSSASSRLKQIHFIDINPNIIRKIQDAFKDMLRGQSDYDVQTFVKQQPSRRHNSPSRQYNYNENSDRYGRNKSMQGSQAVGGSNSASNYATNQGISSDKQNWPPASGISQFSVTPVSQDIEKYIVRFRNSGEPTLILWKRNILSVNASAVVSVEDTKGSGSGKVAEMIPKMISSKKVSEYYSVKRRMFRQTKNIVLGDVLVTKGYDSGYGYIFHVVLAATVVERVMNKDRIKILGSAYDKILKLADHDDIKSLVMPLVGTGDETKDEVKVSADAFIDSYSVFCNRKLQKSTSRPLTLYLVFRDQTNLSLVLSILEKQINDGRLCPVTVPSIPSQPPQKYQPKMADESSGTDDDEKCVMCMDHFTDPRKLDCGHMICSECIDQQFKHKKVCPTCGKVIGDIPEKSRLLKIDSAKTDDKSFSGNLLKGISKKFGNKEELMEKKSLSCYVEIENILEGTTVDQLKTLLSGLPIVPPELVFRVGMVKAIAICQGENDAVKLSQVQAHHHTLKFKHLKKVSFGRFTQKLDAKFLNMVHKKKEYDNLVDDLLAIEVNLANDSIETQTSIQMQCANIIVASYGRFELVSVLKVSALVWDIVRTVKAKEISVIKSQQGTVEMDSSDNCITIITVRDDMEPGKIVSEFTESIKKNEIDEIEIDDKDADNAPLWCKEIQATFDSSFCIFIPDAKKVAICCEIYDDILKIKHQFLVKQGKVRPTARSGRRRRVLDSEPPTTVLARQSADIRDNGYCVTCKTNYTDPRIMDCGHTFCRACIDQQFQHKKVCPTCGRPCGIITGEEPKRLIVESELVGVVNLEKSTVSDVDANASGVASGREIAESDFVGNVAVENVDIDPSDGVSGQLMAESDFVGTIKLESKPMSNVDANSSDDSDNDADHRSMDNFEIILKCADKEGGRSLRILRAELGVEALKWRYIFQKQDKRNELEQKLKTFAATLEYKGESPVVIETNKVLRISTLSKNIKQHIQSETSGLHVEEAIADADEVEKVIGIMSYASSALTNQSVLRFMQHPQGQTKVWFVGVGEDVSDVLNLFKQTQSFLSNITLSGATQIKQTK